MCDPAQRLPALACRTRNELRLHCTPDSLHPRLLLGLMRCAPRLRGAASKLAGQTKIDPLSWEDLDLLAVTEAGVLSSWELDAWTYSHAELRCAPLPWRGPAAPRGASGQPQRRVVCQGMGAPVAWAASPSLQRCRGCVEAARAGCCAAGSSSSCSTCWTCCVSSTSRRSIASAWSSISKSTTGPTPLPSVLRRARRPLPLRYALHRSPPLTGVSLGQPTLVADSFVQTNPRCP